VPENKMHLLKGYVISLRTVAIHLPAGDTAS